MSCVLAARQCDVLQEQERPPVMSGWSLKSQTPAVASASKAWPVCSRSMCRCVLNVGVTLYVQASWTGFVAVPGVCSAAELSLRVHCCCVAHRWLSCVCYAAWQGAPGEGLPFWTSYTPCVGHCHVMLGKPLAGKSMWCLSWPALSRLRDAAALLRFALRCADMHAFE